MLWVKSFHIIFMVTWFAALFYLPRLYVYHASAEDSISHERFKIMERKLFWGIATPGAIITIILGLWLASYFPLIYSSSWFQTKLGIVTLLVIYHVWCGKLMIDFKYDRNTRSHKWYRVFNELPVFGLIAIILLVELQPVF
ncbi:MAG: protoporphyrinogen oxidase HemJ [Gammaproteobacteria bacterium]|nr:protoporphyrinogen oxidase HemJ [Gammaproteobacteria bacterium]